MMRFLSLTIVAACATAGCASSSSARLSAEELKVIVAIGRAQQKAINAEDVDKIVALYEPDAVSLPPGWKALQGREAIRRFWEGQVTGVDGTGSYDTVLIYGEDQLAYEVGTYTYSFIDSGKTTTRYGKYLTVYRRQPDGFWRIAADTWNFTPAP